MLNKIVNKSKIALTASLCAVSLHTMAEELQFNVAPPQLNAQTFILMDYHSGAVLASLNPDQRQYPASLTKMMTSYVVGTALKQGKINNTDTVTIGESAWGKNFPGSSKMFLNLNQQVSVADLNRGIVVVSGNDACVALAEHISGSTQVFIDSMNKFAQQFGLKNTHFTTVHGLDDENQYSSARDMAIIGAHIIRDLPEEYKLYAEKEFTFNKITQPNRNGLLWGFNSFETFKTLEAGKAVSKQTLYYGAESEVPLGVLQDGFITIPKGRNTELKARFELDSRHLEAPLVKGQVVGKVIYQLDGKDVAKVNLQVMKDVEEGGFFSKIWDWLVLTIKGLFD